MYSDHYQVNCLTALLAGHGVTHAVVCPGSRNGAIVHNLDACPAITCHGVTDERSAGFYALGIAQATGRAAAVCVTSGTALLDLMPAVAEAQYQHVPIVVVSADRPQQWIGQMDGQTLPQAGALDRWCRHSVSLPDKTDSDEARWYCNRLVNEALTAMYRGGAGPVHINVPIQEPLFGFGTPALPDERVVRCIRHHSAVPDLSAFVDEWHRARRPMVVVGQMPAGHIDAGVMGVIGRHAVVVHDKLAYAGGGIEHVDQVLDLIGNDEAAWPDLVVYMGGSVVSKRLKQWLRDARRRDVPQWRVALDDGMPDTFMHLTGLIEADPALVVRVLAQILEAPHPCPLPPEEGGGNNVSPTPDRGGVGGGVHTEVSPLPPDTRYLALWHDAEEQVCVRIADEELPFDERALVRYLEEQVDEMYPQVQTHYANSTAIRLANMYATHHVWCNRGVNGIDGSISTAAGYSLAHDGITLCVTGDLSFFYDQNALWQADIDGRLRILLINNGGGKIFRTLPGLKDSRVSGTLVSGGHGITARGICTQNDIGYLYADNWDDARIDIVTLLTRDARRPMLLEVRM